MSEEELQKTFEQMKAQNVDDQSILGGIYKMFQDGKINLEQLDAIANELGYQLSDDFKSLPEEQQKTVGDSPNPIGNTAPGAKEEATPEAAEGKAPAPAPEGSESHEKEEGSAEEAKEEQAEASNKPSPSSQSPSAPAKEQPEDDERKKAFGLMGIHD